MINIKEVSDKITRSNNYNYYGRVNTLFENKLITEDELDDALGLSADDGQSPPTDDSTENLPEDNPEGDMPTDNVPDLEGTDNQEDATIDVDVTQLVLKQDEMARNIKDLVSKIESLTSLKDDLSAPLQNAIEQMGEKIMQSNASMLDELRKRLPSKVEQMDLQSLHSYPYNIKLTDFWKPTEDTNVRQQSNVNLQKPENAKPEEYILTQNDVNGFEGDIKNSF